MVYEDIINNKSLVKIHRDIYNYQQEKKKQGVIISNMLPAFAIGLANKIVNHMPKYAKMNADTRAEYFFDVLKKENSFDKTSKIINEEIRRESGKKKEQLIQGVIKEARKQKKIFYICSSHDDCASDHKDYQGQIYVDESWDRTNAEIADYVILNNIKTFQWITFRPVWMTTRPYCRHYFKALDTEDVLSHSVSQLTKNHRMHHKSGKYEMQTIRYKTGQETLQAYRERLRYHEYLYGVYKTETLRKLISKDKLLINKWMDFLKK